MRHPGRILLQGLLVSTLLSAQLALAQTTYQFDLPPQALADALRSVGRVTHTNVLFDPPLIDGLRAPALKGALSADQAFAKLLAGTSLRNKLLDDKTVTIVSRESAQPADSARSEALQTPSDQRNDATPFKEAGKKNSSQDFRVAQVDQGTSGNTSSVKKQEDQESKRKKADQLEEVVVTGSRIPTTGAQSAQEVKVYTREQIDNSGQTTVSDFLSTLPDVSLASTENPNQQFQGGTTVQLHGLPVGTTLVLLNGRRIEPSGAQASEGAAFFDLNNIPLAAVERIEIVSEGSSAVYGSDAIAGVVNIILRRDFEGLEFGAKYGGASGTSESTTSIALGTRWSRGAVSIIGSFQSREELTGFDRAITANSDYRRYGGIDARGVSCNPGNVFSADGATPLHGLGGATYAAVPAGYTGTPTQQEFAGTAGTLNKCSTSAYNSYIPATRRAGVFAFGSFNLTPSIELFAELLYSHVQQNVASEPPELTAYPQFSYFPFTVAASNPFNPFGVAVGVGDLLTQLGASSRPLDTDFLRPLVGGRGGVFGAWKWEVAAWDSEDTSNESATNYPNPVAVQNALNSTDPSTALNPFVAGPQGSPQLLQSLVTTLRSKFLGRTVSANGFVRGPIANLPGGPIEIVLGAEFDKNTLYSNFISSPSLPPNTETTHDRRSHAIFAEARVPIIGKRADPQAGDTLAITLAGRRDIYSDFGASTSPQFGAEWRPLETLLIRGTYGEAFVAPNLTDLYYQGFTAPGYPIVDPLRGNAVEAATVVFGGNPRLQPQTGQSRTFGLVYSSKTVPNLQVTATHWSVTENKSIQILPPQTLVDNENLFGAQVIRAPSQGGQPGPITRVNYTWVNFGELNVAGLDYQVNYKLETDVGAFMPSLSATQTYRYTAALQPGAPATDRTSKASDDASWAPRWKGTAALGWNLGPYSAHVDGRYVGRYQDYDSTQEVGNFWICDANVRYAIGEVIAHDKSWLKGAYVEIGSVNIFNRLPYYSNYSGGVVGYDPAQADIRGRFVYAQVHVRW